MPKNTVIGDKPTPTYLQKQIDELKGYIKALDIEKEVKTDDLATKENLEKFKENYKQELAEFKESAVGAAKGRVDKKIQEITENLADRINSQEKKIADYLRSTAQKEGWSWGKFFVGLSKIGIPDGVIVSSLVLAIGQLINYLELLELPEGSVYLVFSGLLVTILKTIKQTLKKQNIEEKDL